MSLGNNPADNAHGERYSERLTAKADAERSARLAGHKSLFRRLLERLRATRNEADGGTSRRRKNTP
jgi:hypothetical protein